MPSSLRFRVDHQRVARRELVERVAARLLVEMRAGHVERGLAGISGCRDQLAHHAFTQAREQHEMAGPQKAQRLRELARNPRRGSS